MKINKDFINFTKNKQKRNITQKVNYLIIHHTAGYFPSDYRWLSGQSPASGVSIHYLINKKGEIFQCVSEDYIAYHTGQSNIGPKITSAGWGWNLNPFSIGIELSNTGKITDEYTKEQIEALIELSVDIVKRYNIPIQNILGHYEITTRKNDPSKGFFNNRMNGFREHIKNIINNTNIDSYNTKKYKKLIYNNFLNTKLNNDIQDLLNIGLSYIEKVNKGEKEFKIDENGKRTIFENKNDNGRLKTEIEDYLFENFEKISYYINTTNDLNDFLNDINLKFNK